MIPGEIISHNLSVELNTARNSVTIMVTNLGDRPIQVGSHFHFFEVNKNLQFPRHLTLGYHLDIPAGTATRFEPGEVKTVQLVEFAGAKRIIGFNNLVNDVIDANTSVAAIAKMQQYNFATQNEEV